MNEKRIIVTQFCDDVRYEMGNKFSLIGCYSDELIVEKLPVALPKLCVQIRVFTLVEKPFSKLVIRALLGEEIIAEADLHVNEAAILNAPPDAKRMGLTTFMCFAPLGITEPTVLQIEAETEEGPLKGGRLVLRERTATEPALDPQ
jgi:hypothetical protein